MNLKYSHTNKTIFEIAELYKNGALNLNPAFQRKSVWAISDRKKLLTSILEGYPIPAIFIYQTKDDNGSLEFIVIDGKQRLEAIFAFMGLIKGESFQTKALIREDDNEREETLDWKTLIKRKQQGKIESFDIPIIEIEGDLSEVINLFIKINSTGKRLSNQEQRKAKFSKSLFLDQSMKLSKVFRDYFIGNKVLSKIDCDRMKDVEFCSELIATVMEGDFLNKKQALDKYYASMNISNKTKIISATDKTKNIIRLLEKIFPDIKTTIFASAVNFYSLFFLIFDLDRNKNVFDDLRIRKMARGILIKFSNSVDDIKIKHKNFGKNADIIDPNNFAVNYFMAMRNNTDAKQQRAIRAKILSDVFDDIFVHTKDSQRGFNETQRRLLWNGSEEKECKKCGEVLTWDNFTIDHIKPYSKGGRTSLDNAQLMCRSCNSRKGNRQ